VHIATQNGTATLPVQCDNRDASSNPDHQLVIAVRDDMHAQTILTSVAQRSAAICEEMF
jgi:hypothetical protein